MTIHLPDACLVVLVGPSGSGKSTFAKAHFLPTEILSSDFFRAMLADDESDQSVSAGAFELLHLAASKRLAYRRTTAIDATNVRTDARKHLLDIARKCGVPAIAIVLNVPPEECHARNQHRVGRSFGPEVVRRHAESMQLSLAHLSEEGFRAVHVLNSATEVSEAKLERDPLPIDKNHEAGPFDIIGDVHGCFDELQWLLAKLGYDLTEPLNPIPPLGRKLIFVGDLVDRGPDSPGVLRLAMNAIAAGRAFCVAGNHDDKCLRYLKGNGVKVAHGLQLTLDQLAEQPPEFRDATSAFLGTLPIQLSFDGGRLIVAHAGLPEDLHGKQSARAKAFALYGDTSGESDELGLPIRANWAENYRGAAMVVYGHVVTRTARWQNRTICLDTGCVFGGELTALRYPEGELVRVPAVREYFEPKRPLNEIG